MWETEFTFLTPSGFVEYQTKALPYHSHAERPDRVKVAGTVVHHGWVSDRQGFSTYKRLAHFYCTEETHHG